MATENYDIREIIERKLLEQARASQAYHGLEDFKSSGYSERSTLTNMILQEALGENES